MLKVANLELREKFFSKAFQKECNYLNYKKAAE